MYLHEISQPPCNTREEIELFLDELGWLHDSTIREDLTVDIYFDVEVKKILYLSNEIPFKINDVHGNFYANDLKLKNLHNFPNKVYGKLELQGNDLLSLEGIPKIILTKLDLGFNPLETFKYLPDEVGALVFGRSINIYDPYEWRYLLFKKIKQFDFFGNDEQNLIARIITKYLDNPDPSQLHLVLARLMEYGESIGFEYD